jgi:hypothetical protein
MVTLKDYLTHYLQPSWGFQVCERPVSVEYKIRELFLEDAYIEAYSRTTRFLFV